jgi:hypothetical protein
MQASHAYSNRSASLLTPNKQNVKLVQERLRHANAKIIMDIYSQAGYGTNGAHNHAPPKSCGRRVGWWNEEPHFRRAPEMPMLTIVKPV